MARILVSGAGVAGFSLAYWLLRDGHDVTIVERAPAPRQGGQGVDIRGAARTVVERMGVGDAVRAAHTGVRGFAQIDGTGRRRVEMPTERLGHSGGAVAEIEILRGDLVAVLRDAAEAAAASAGTASSGTSSLTYQFDDTITAVDRRPGGVAVEFEKAAPARFDVVVGADGAFSVTRRLAFDGAWRAVDSGYHRAVFAVDDPRVAAESGAEDWMTMYSLPAGNGVGGRNVLLYPARGGARAMVHFASDPLGLDRRDVAGQKEAVAEVYAGAGWVVPRLMDAMWRADDFYFDRHQRIEASSWHRGRVALLGDACAAGSVGMGTSIAIVGAYVLAAELRAAGTRDDDVAAALARYEARVRPYAIRNGKPLPGGLRGFLPSSEREIRTRLAIGGLLMRTPLARLMTGLDKNVDAIELPETWSPRARAA
ncbi:FAD-dependent monooxygenase [Myceligenerans crystallogenes]|uniref:FAD-dependent monooxygenase n=1 Tax=Myceligenerans crystallogenes TaxID=316335 RepID=A0ABN2NHI1_9MICO